MEKYTKAQMEVIEFENEDVIATSSCIGDACGCNGNPLYDEIGFGGDCGNVIPD